ncbi:MAG: type II secretion system F family protein [Limnothrix sp. CACIAM 69d]|jgi:type IV pilus assembly protein PilC|uniref:type II secretion system F family protein n=1 Tax=Limnothrix sp. PR1529 TaxID=1704291 RepID=UPI00081F7288|nr:type II secretion system F family protein [Limnothrix sp. PR1529]OCQ98135.1 pilus assembly protein PilC [Limnothrix sp. P13C2]PIB03521.1 pilus assembly protein PilC [Limnothrix sp. PR1529]RFP52080.1 MAG: type II secretion system F family protein [Limnothrix sp. CACIAM 69d]
MAKFIATIAGPDGKGKREVVEAESINGARNKLIAAGFSQAQIRDLKEQKSGLDIDLASLTASVTVKDLAVFSRQFSAMFNAGIAMVKCLDILSNQCENPKLKKALFKINADVQEGETLSSSLKRHGDIFSKLYCAMVEAGEIGGVLDEVLTRLATLLENAARLQNQIKSAMSYPSTVGSLAVIIFLGMTIFLLPTFTGIFDKLGAELPAFTQIMINISEFLRGPTFPDDDPKGRKNFYVVFLVIALVIGKVVYDLWYKTPAGKRQMDAVFLKLPIFGDIIQKSSVASFCRTFGTLTRSGVPIIQALEICKDTADNQVVSDAVASSIAEIQGGGTISAAIERYKVFPAMAIQMMMIGEETGELDKMLMKVADFYEDEVEQAIKGLTSMLEPLMIVVIGGMVGSILLAMYLPIFAVMDAIK